VRAFASAALAALVSGGCALTPGHGDRVALAFERERVSCQSAEPDRRLIGPSAREVSARAKAYALGAPRGLKKGREDPS
jgi:hypothetical protein